MEGALKEAVSEVKSSNSRLAAKRNRIRGRTMIEEHSVRKTEDEE